jgi:hypothetical protein
VLHDVIEHHPTQQGGRQAPDVHASGEEWPATEHARGGRGCPMRSGAHRPVDRDRAVSAYHQRRPRQPLGQRGRISRPTGPNRVDAQLPRLRQPKYDAYWL